ncbi:hypothetical protein Tco_1222138 [Tanacetum coccineum]
MLWIAEFINDEPNEHVYGAQETSKKDMDVYIDANNAADINDTLDESARVQVDKTENRKAPRKGRKDKLVALAEKRKNKQGEKDGQGVVRKGKLAAIVEKTKKEQAEKGTGKHVAVKRKKAILYNKAADELDESSDDAFVTNVGARHRPGIDKEKGLGRKKLDDDTTRSVKGLKGKGKSTDDDCGNVKRGKDVRDIGFGAFLKYKIKGVPKWLAYWLLDKFDEDTCSLNVNNRTIMITSKVVRNLLRVPMGEDVKRHYNTHVANEIVEKGRSGLNKLEADVFPKDYGGDTDVGEEAELEVSDEEQVLEEDDVEEDYYSVGVPTDLEALGMKKYVSALLKKAGELVEMADEVLDQVTQMYGSPTGYGELQDKVWEEWHRKVEQIPTRLNFNEADDIDFNVTQPPATQGKVVGGAEDENNMEEDESLLDAIRNYVSQETIKQDKFFTPDQTIGVREKESKTSRFGTDSNEMVDSKAMVPAFSQPKPLNVLPGNFPYGRPKRRVVLPKVLRSPYVVREVSYICGISPHESRAANCLFSRLIQIDIVFKMSHVDGPRSVLESLYLGVDVASGAIDLFTNVLNEAEKRKNIHTVNRLFCHTAMVTSDMRGWEYETACEKFNENMEDVLKNSLYKTIKGVELGGITKNNFLDCGVFVMRHMETFKGDVDCCGFSKEGEKQIEEL